MIVFVTLFARRCHTDIHMRDNDWNNAVYPMVCGHEVVGIVERVGANVTEHKVVRHAGCL